MGRKAQDLQKHPGDHDQSVHNPHGGEGAGEAKEQPSERGRKEGERIGSAANDLVEHLKEMEARGIAQSVEAHAHCVVSYIERIKIESQYVVVLPVIDKQL